MAKFQKGQSGNPKGRPKGAKDLVPRGTVRAAAQEFLRAWNGHELVVECFKRGMAKPGGKLALSHLQVLQKSTDGGDEQAGAHVHIHINTNLDKSKLGGE